jgi:hypothetical protein
MSFLTMGLYISGNFNDFMDVTQRLLLRTAGTTGVCLFFFVTIGVILDLFMIFHMKLTYAVGFIFYVIVGGIGALITLTTLFIQTLTVG